MPEVRQIPAEKYDQALPFIADFLERLEIRTEGLFTQASVKARVETGNIDVFAVTNDAGLVAILGRHVHSGGNGELVHNIIFMEGLSPLKDWGSKAVEAIETNGQIMGCTRFIVAARPAFFRKGMPLEAHKITHWVGERHVS